MKHKHLRESPVRKDVNGGNPLGRLYVKEAENSFRQKKKKTFLPLQIIRDTKKEEKII